MQPQHLPVDQSRPPEALNAFEAPHAWGAITPAGVSKLRGSEMKLSNHSRYKYFDSR